MRVRLLGPVDLVVDGTPRPVQGLRRSAILAALALQPGETVSADRLVDAVWGDTPPAAPAATLQSHVSHLRRVLGAPAAILAQPPGYVLHLDGGDTDVQAAADLIARGGRAADPAERERLLRAAVDLWRGPALADLTALPWFVAPAQHLDDLFDQARDGLFDARLALGQHAQLIAELEELTAEHPHREPAYGRLMLALYRSGRQGDALAAYQRLRRTLDEDLGIGPSQPLRDLEAAVLRQDPALNPPAAPTGVVPAQLPPVVATFAGRTGELARLDGIVARANGAAVVISAVSGTAGIGKTTLAVHWAHRNAPRFPDGQLYVNLRGFDPGGAALDPAEAVRDFLDALGVAPDRVPAGLAAQVGLYRSLIAGKRVLVVLDNARDAAQVRPLLPGTPGCLALVTSRDRLASLVAAEGAHPLTLDVLSHAESRDLLARRLGAGRVTREPEAVDAIIARCARLPLALAIAAARAAGQPHFPLAALAADLRNALDAFDGGDAATDIRAVFSWSYRTLSEGAARLFRLLGLHPGPDVSTATVASLAALAPPDARRLLGELTRAHLLIEPAPGRYTFHDLLRAYATERAHAEDDATVRDAARRRMLEHYLRSAYPAALALFPRWDPIDLGPGTPGVEPEQPAGEEAALQWFAAEYHVLGALIEQAAIDRYTWQLAWLFTTYLLRRGYRDERAALQRTGLDAAIRLGDRVGEACLLRALGLGYVRWERLAEADDYFGQSLRVYESIGHSAGQAHAYTGLAESADKRGEPAVAMAHAERALDLFRAAGDDPGYANSLNAIGWCAMQLGDYRRALEYCTEAVERLQQLGDRDGESGTWDSLGHAHHHLGDFPQAIACFERAIELCHDLGDRYYEADSLASLGDSHRAAGDPDAAAKAWQRALDLFEELDHPGAEEVRRRFEVNADGTNSGSPS